ncbi:MAG TPA: peptidase T [Bacillota bacterium]|nr:peptidase T [Bacillota bacterium]
MKQQLINRLITYAKIDTQSHPDSMMIPTTEGQLTLAHMLVQELKDIGLTDVTIDDNGYVMATVEANTDKDVPTIGFLAHVDTATEVTGKNVNPQITESFHGSHVTLNEDKNIVLHEKDFPNLKKYEGHTLITTDGTTLLGADNKAGIAEIITAVEYLVNNPSIEHGKIRIAFTPDEEIGRGPHYFDVKAFGADCAYTIDGGPLGELQYESFHAAMAKVTCKGTNVHPGTAKNKLVHATKIMNAFINRLPEKEAPEHTEGYEGFFHILSLNSDVETAELTLIIRDFDRDAFEQRKAFIQTIADDLKNTYGDSRTHVQIEDQYYNMREKIVERMEIVTIAEEAMKHLQIDPVIEPIRGGTDGSQLSFMGLPTPNIFTGGENFHSIYEFISADDMVQATKTIIEISKRFAENN